MSTKPDLGALDRVAHWLETSSPWRVLAAAALVRVATVGAWTTPNVDQWLLFASDPFGDPPIDPAAAFIKACKLIYDVVMFFVNNASRILDFVNTVIDSVADMVRGNVGAVVDKINDALNKQGAEMANPFKF